MRVDKENDFDGFITEDGTMIDIEDVESVSALFLQATTVDDAVTTLRRLTSDCLDMGRLDAARGYYEKILLLVDSPEEKAECFLVMGGILENLSKYREAEETYARAFDLPQESNHDWYFLNNNRGYCLNQTGRHTEAAVFCLDAIRIDPERHNAYKNLGIALMHLGRYAEAAQNLVRATELCPADPRALAILDEIYVGHRERVREMPDFPAQLLRCHELVQDEQKGKAECASEQRAGNG